MARKHTSHKSSKALRVINPHACGIDLGATEHWVCCPSQDGSDPEVRSFPTDTPSLLELADWLRKCGVTSVAMESTGVYWIPLYELLCGQGFEVSLIDTRTLSRVPGRKTDVLDCQWIQQLHSYGLLRGAFRPADDIVKFRALERMKKTLMQEQADWQRRMQKELDQMNVRVHRAVSEITGVTGMAIVHAIVDGERDPAKLAELRDARCKKSVKQIERELSGTWRKEHLQNLATALHMYEFINERIEEVSQQVMDLLENYRIIARSGKDAAPPLPCPRKMANIKRNGEEPMRQALFGLAGVDLTRIVSIGVKTAEILLSEFGPDISSFPTEKQFISYLRLSPALGISGGKPVRNRKKPLIGCNRSREALRMAALAARHTNTALGAYYRKIAVRKGANVAVFATARKLAQYVYRMLRFGTEYVDIGIEKYEEQCQQRRIKRLQNTARNLGYQLVTTQQPATVS